MTDQELFDRVVEHLHTQNAKSYDAESSPGCLYRGPDKRKCAIGGLIPDECYTAKLEGVAVPASLAKSNNKDGVKALMRATGIQESQLLLAHKLQQLHDVQPVGLWPFELAKLAEEQELVTSASLMGWCKERHQERMHSAKT